MSFFEFPHTRTYDKDLGWLIHDYKDLDEALKAIDEWAEKTDSTVKELKEIVDQIDSGQLPDAMENAIHIWLQTHAGEIIPDIVGAVFFGLTQDGYFVAYIPDSWNDIIFGTSGLDDFPAGVDFGHLTLSY